MPIHGANRQIRRFPEGGMQNMKSFPPSIALIAVLLALTSCTSYEGTKELLMGGEGLTHNFEGEVMENLIRASKGMPFIHYDVSNFQSLITQKIIPNIGTTKSIVYNSFPRGFSRQTTTATGKSPTTQVTDTIGASVSSVSQALTKGTTFGLSGERDNAGTLNMVPIYDEKVVYQAYINYLNIDRNDAKVEDEARGKIDECETAARKLWEDIRVGDIRQEQDEIRIPKTDLDKFSESIRCLYGYRNIKLVQTELKKLEKEFAGIKSIASAIVAATDGKPRPADKDAGGDQTLKITQVTTLKRDKEPAEIVSDETAASERSRSAQANAVALRALAMSAPLRARTMEQAAAEAEDALAKARKEGLPSLEKLAADAHKARAAAITARTEADTADEKAAKAEKLAQRMADLARPEAIGTTYQATETIKQPASESTPPHLFMPPMGDKFNSRLRPLECQTKPPKAGTYVAGAKMKWDDGWYYVPIQYQNQFSDLCLALVARSPGGNGGGAPVSMGLGGGKKQSKAAIDNAANLQQQNAILFQNSTVPK